MTIKTLRKGYENLSLLQRLSLADNAMARDDASEALAIKKASPKVHLSQPDFLELFDEITRIRLCNLIVRLGYLLNFDFFLLGLVENVNSPSSLEISNRRESDLRLAAFLYVRATDAWNAVNDQLGLRPNFDEELAGTLLSIELLQWKDAMMRLYAFSEDEAREYLRVQKGRTEIRTMEQEIEEYLQYLKLR